MQRYKSGAMALAIATILIGVAGCSKDEPKPASAAESPAQTSGQTARAANRPVANTTVGMEVVAETAKATFTMDAPLEAIKGDVPIVSGHIDLVPNDLAASRGELRIDMQSLKTQTFGDPGKDSTQSNHAQGWLGLGDQVEPAERQANRYATFTIREVVSSSAKTLTEVRSFIDGDSVARKVSLDAKGVLTLRGKSSDKLVHFELLVRAPADRPDEPSSVTLRTTEPVPVVLADHDVYPRDAAGKLMKGMVSAVGELLGDLGKKVAKEAQVSVTFEAKKSTK